MLSSDWQKLSSSGNQTHTTLFEKQQVYGNDIASNREFKLACYVYSGCGVLFGSENLEDPASVKSRTRYLIKFGFVSILWVSNFKKIAISTMEAEYIALYQAMRDLIPIRETVKEIYYKVFKKQLNPKCTAQSKIFSETQ